MIVLASLLGIFVVARNRTEAVQIEYRGVKVINTSRVAVGVGVPELDISLENASTPSRAWNVVFSNQRDGWHTAADLPPEELLVSRSATSGLVQWIARTLNVDFWQPLSGTVTRPSSDVLRLVVPAELHDASEPDSVTFRLEPRGESVFAVAGDREWRVWSESDSLAFLNRERLRRGLYLSELSSNRGDMSPLGDLVRIRMLRSSERVEEPSLRAVLAAIAERVHGKPISQERFFLSAEAPVSIQGAVPLPDRGVPESENVEIIARTGSDVWRFSLRPEPDGVLVEFRRRPKRRLFPLMAESACPAGASCNVVSLKRLPPPSPQFLLSEGGLDSSRFELFGRLSFDQDAVWFASDRTKVHISEDESGTLIPARRIATGGGGGTRASVILIARRATLSASWDIIAIAFGVALILVGLFLLINSALSHGTGFASSVDERPVALVLNGLLSLALARLILGTRVATFRPFLPRGVATAIGLWISIAVALSMLLLWKQWFPFLSEWHQRGWGRTFQNLRHAMAALNRERLFGWIRNRSFVALFVAAILLGWTSFDAIQNGVFLGLVVAAMWASLSTNITWIAPASRSFDVRCLQGPWAVLEATLPIEKHSQLGILGKTTIVLFGCWCAAVFPFFYVALLAGGLALRIVLGLFRNKARLGLDYPLRTVALAGTPIALLAAISDSKSAAALAFALTVALYVIRGSVSIRQSARMRASGFRGFVADFGGAALPILLLSSLLATDVGLFLIVVIPVVLAGYIASNVFRTSRLRVSFSTAVLVAIFGVLVWRLIALPTERITAGSALQVDQSVRGLQTFLGAERVAKVRRSLANVASRGLAAKSQPAAERALALSGPGETRQYLLRAIEQTWGTKAYAASGIAGSGIGESPIGGRGVAEAVAYAENSFAVFVLSEHGALGGLTLLACYLLVVVGTVFLLLERTTLIHGRKNNTMRAVLVLSIGLLVLPACYVAASNVGALPITGQNMPFIGLNAWSDVLFCTGIISFFLIASLRLNAEALGAATEALPPKGPGSTDL